MTEPAHYGKYSKTIRELHETIVAMIECADKTIAFAIAGERERCAKIAEVENQERIARLIRTAGQE